jgi:hypothetical protein
MFSRDEYAGMLFESPEHIETVLLKYWRSTRRPQKSAERTYLPLIARAKTDLQTFCYRLAQNGMATQLIDYDSCDVFSYTSLMGEMIGEKIFLEISSSKPLQVEEMIANNEALPRAYKSHIMKLDELNYFGAVNISNQLPRFLRRRERNYDTLDIPYNYKGEQVVTRWTKTIISTTGYQDTLYESKGRTFCLTQKKKPETSIQITIGVGTADNFPKAVVSIQTIELIKSVAEEIKNIVLRN